MIGLTPRPEVWLTVIDSPNFLQQSSCCPGRTASTVRLYFFKLRDFFLKKVKKWNEAIKNNRLQQLNLIKLEVDYF